VSSIIVSGFMPVIRVLSIVNTCKPESSVPAKTSHGVNRRAVKSKKV